MSEMLERVARTIAETGNGGVWSDERWYKESQREFHRKRARAAIEAMREPTQEMLDAGGWGVSQWNGDMTPEAEAVAQAAWPAMIDAALKSDAEVG